MVELLIEHHGMGIGLTLGKQEPEKQKLYQMNKYQIENQQRQV